MNMSTNILSMIAVILIAIACVLAVNTEIGNGDGQHPLQGQDLSLVEDDGSMDAALMNYLYARMIFKQLENNQDVSRLLRKRNYWKQCAFNAVSCFGRRRK